MKPKIDQAINMRAICRGEGRTFRKRENSERPAYMMEMEEEVYYCRSPKGRTAAQTSRE